MRVNLRIFTTEVCCPMDSLELHGGGKDFRTKTPCNSVYSVVNSFFLLLLSLFIISCADVVSPPLLPGKPGIAQPLPAGYGSFTPVIAHNTARTILPAAPALSDFTRFELHFTPVDGQGVALTIERPYTDTGALEPVELIAGTYNLLVNAYKDSEIAARGTLNNIVISAAENVPGTVVLHALFDEGAGTFTWSITLDASPIAVNTATMTIKDSNGTVQEPVVTLASSGITAGSRALPSGLYTVVFTIHGVQNNVPRTLVWNELLHIYAELESEFSITFTAKYFTNTHWNVTFSENYTGGGSSTLSVMHGGVVGGSLPAPERTNYIFLGWNTQANGSGTPFAADTAVTEHMTVYAQWKFGFPSVAAFETWLAVQPANTADDPYEVALNIDESDIVNLRTTLYANSTKYVDIDLSGSTITSIGDSAFYNCTNLTGIIIPNSVTSIGRFAFRGSSLTEITIPNSVTVIAANAFVACTSLKSVIIGNGVTSIGDDAFSYCTSLASVTIPDSVTAIGRDAFKNTPWLNNQPDGVVYAGKVAYTYKGTMLANTSIQLLDGTKGIADGAFERCTNLTSIIIPDSVTSIGIHAYAGCTSLSSVTIGNSVTSIGLWAFAGTSLTSVIIPNGVTSIETGVFYDCTSLTSITIPNSVTSIRVAAFDSCSSLSSVTIGNSVTSISNGVFYGCTSLTSVTFQGTITASGFGSAFDSLGDLREKFYATDPVNGTPGTYVTTAPVSSSSVWEKTD